MIEIPEAENLARQLTATVSDKLVSSVVVDFSPHKFAFYYDNPQNYDALLRGKSVGKTVPHGGMVEMKVGDAIVLFSDGVVLKYHLKDEPRPKKHQLLIEFNDATALSGSVQMYGGLWCFREGEFDNPYYESAKSKPSPLSSEFNDVYFGELINNSDAQKLSVKAFLATEQRIPGLGNGVLQDILYEAKIHPKRKVSALSNNERQILFQSVKSVLQEMTTLGGRDTTRDLFGESGGYQTKLSQLTAGKACPICGGTIVKQSYLGGSIYFCDKCQKI